MPSRLPLRRLQNQSGDAWKEDLLLVFKAHQLLSPAETQIRIPHKLKPIVVLAEEPDLQCWNPTCGAEPGLRLWDATNWCYGPRWLRLDTLLNSLPGFLDRNCYERRLFFQLIGATDARPRDNLGRKYLKIIEAVDVVPEMTVGRVLQELCDLPVLIQDEEYSLLLENDDFSGLTTNDLLCANCLQKMIKARLGLWWRYMKEKYAPQEHEKASCRYGFQCRLQPWKPRHAARCNHARPNTSGPERRIRRAEKRRKCCARTTACPAREMKLRQLPRFRLRPRSPVCSDCSCARCGGRRSTTATERAQPRPPPDSRYPYPKSRRY
ncbi:hypothetical protein EXIGLDRAFT_847600 [Exidia glandulosa HHB12029]|uniref:Uncharacterized protein n=1 Tax=Exidia glandulosa HHB12029 TaxID=1314781 RepID=A0A166MT91_EXIGL|nr:hypothetical protein EXIGLDRAFT_847600 [Exidia glandulosa HHB12029]